MKAVTFVDGVLLAAIIATWIWTWTWNRYVVTHRPTPDYDAANSQLTTELFAVLDGAGVGVVGARIGYMPVEAYRAQMTRRVVDAAFASGDETTGEIEVVK